MNLQASVIREPAWTRVVRGILRATGPRARAGSTEVPGGVAIERGGPEGEAVPEGPEGR